MDRAASLLEILLMNQKADTVQETTSQGPVWKRYVQSHSYQRPLERVCGTESDVEAMRGSLSSTAASSREAVVRAGLGGLAVMFIMSVA